MRKKTNTGIALKFVHDQRLNKHLQERSLSSNSLSSHVLVPFHDDNKNIWFSQLYKAVDVQANRAWFCISLHIKKKNKYTLKVCVVHYCKTWWLTQFQIGVLHSICTFCQNQVGDWKVYPYSFFVSTSLEKIRDMLILYSLKEFNTVW